MQLELLETLRCPVTKTKLTLKIIKEEIRKFDTVNIPVITEGILFAEKDWFYPIIKSIPRLCIESFIDYKDFFADKMSDYHEKANLLKENYGSFLEIIIKKNKQTKESFAKEWEVFDYKTDKTWNADDTQMLQRFYNETDETAISLKPKFIFDAGCGNGKLNNLLGSAGIKNIGMDFSISIEAADFNNQSANTHFIQGDVQFPAVAFNHFDIVHCSGVLIHTNNTELSFSCLSPTVKENGKLSVWLYHPRKDFIHNLFNALRRITTKLPSFLQQIIYYGMLFPLSFCVKKIKGNKQNSREMLVDILDWFTPEFRHEHTHEEAASWFYKRKYKEIKVTTKEVFGFNIIGVKA
jgi:SAM-dependent methyltransferase/uncharacterized protein YbaR (Trm112 family)